MKKFVNLIVFLFFLSVVLVTNVPRQTLARECLPDQFCYWSCEEICRMFPWEKICPCPKPNPTVPLPTPTSPPAAIPTLPPQPTPTEAPGEPTLTPTQVPGEPTPTEGIPTPTPTLTPVSEGGGVGGLGAPGPVGPPHCGATVPLAPTLLRVSSVASDKQELEWTAVEPATHYSVYYGRSSGNYEYGVANTGKTTTFAVGSLDSNTNYCFAVRAVNDCAPSELSNEICTGQVLGARTKVLGATGSKEIIEWLMEMMGFLFLLSGLCLKRKILVVNFWKGF